MRAKYRPTEFASRKEWGRNQFRQFWRKEKMNDPKDPNNEEFQEPNTGITSEGDVEAYQEPNTGATQEPNTGIAQEPNTN